MESTSDVLILGGGFAGLSCATALAGKGVSVLVLEKKPHLGGRAYSFNDSETGHPVDNGQHLFMGCYQRTRAFLDRIGTAPLLKFSDAVRVDYADSDGKRDVLTCPFWLGSPWHLAAGVMGLRGISWSDKWGLRRLQSSLERFARGGMDAELDRVTVRQWLDSLGQSRLIQTRFFDPVALGALNDDPEVASALGFAQALSGMFFRDFESSRLGLSSVGLSELYTGAARIFIEAKGGRVVLSRKAAGLTESGGRVSGARMEDGECFRAEAVVSTLPPWDLGRLELPQWLRGAWEGLKPAPIVSLCLWLDRPVLEQPMVGLLGTDIQWAFDKSSILNLKGRGQYLSLVISGAHQHVSKDPKDLLEIASRDLSRCLPAFRKANIERWKVVKEPFATLSPVPGSESRRPQPGSGAPGFYFAGDWTRTGLPATIESAVASGEAVAERILSERQGGVYA